MVARVCDAFVQAKAIAASRGPLATPELIELVGDPWPYGLSANRKTLEAFVFEWNLPSARVLEKAGYTLEAKLRKAVTKAGRTVDCFLYARFRE